MGISTSKKKYLTNEEIEKYSANNKTLEKYFNYYRNYEGYFTLKDFAYCFNKIIDKRIIKILFKILASEKDKLHLNDIKYFYSLFQINNDMVKLNLLALMIFGSKNSKIFSKYIDRINLLFDKFTPLRERLLSTDLIIKIADISKGVPIKIHKDLFLKHFDNIHRQFFEQFQFLKSNYVSSITPKKIYTLNFSVCNCFLKPCSQKSNSNNKLYDMIEIEFKRIEKLNDGIFQLNIFEKILSEVGIHTKLINLILIYLKRKVQRSFLDFKTFKLFLLSFTLESNEKIKFLFEILTYPNEYIEKKVFVPMMNSLFEKKIDDDAKDQFNSYFINFSSINLTNFQSFVKENTMMYEVLNNMERVNYIPYLYFKLRPNEKNIEKKCIEMIMKGQTDLKKYIDTIFSSEDEFFCLDVEFWRKWCQYVEWDASFLSTYDSNATEKFIETNSEFNSNMYRPKMNTENLIGEYKTKLKSGLVYFKDFIILTRKIYDLFSRWYVSSGCEIKLEKIIYDVEKLNFKSDSKQIPPQIFKIDCKNVYEIELYPVYSKFFNFEEIFSNISSPEIDLVNQLITTLFEGNKLNMSRLVSYSRNTTLNKIKTNIETYYNIVNKLTRLWVYNKEKKLYLADLQKTLEGDGINNFCLFVLEITKNNEWISDEIFIKKSKEDKMSKENLNNTPSDKILKKDPNNHRIVGFHNIGNTCYMNSILQVLINMKELRDFFLSKNCKFLINYANKFGYQGKVFREFVKLYEEKIQNEISENECSMRPSKFKEVIGEINSQFRNFEQQDAQEFIYFLLDILHEEMNLKNIKEFIPNPEKFDFSEEELANEYWANNLRRNASFIHSMFLGQLKSTLICEKCENKKIIYETFTNLNLPITQKKTISLQIILHRLPFMMKAYYDQYNEIEDNNEYSSMKFESNTSEDIHTRLKTAKKNSYDSYYEDTAKIHDSDAIDQSTQNVNEFAAKALSSNMSQYRSNYSVYASRLSTSIPLKIIIEIECKSKLSKIIEILKNIKELELEIDNNKKNDTYTTYAISSSYDSLFYDLDMKIDECFQNDQTICVHELINTNGINKLLGNNLYSNLISENSKNIDNRLNIIPTQNIILDLSYDSLRNFNKPEIFEKTLLSDSEEELKREYLIQIIHRYPSGIADFYLFQNIDTMRLDFHLGYILVNNDTTKNIKARFLYEYIWEKYEYIFHNPGKIKRLLWWQEMAESQDKESFQEIKNCSPFVIKVLNKENNTCIKCPWFRFCTGCILDPFQDGKIIIYPAQVILVEWCNNTVKEEMNEANLKLVLNHENVKLKEEDKSIKTLTECLNLFLAKELLDGSDQQIYCSKCKGLENFFKKYDIDRAPPVLILTLKRFKFAKLYKNKIDAFIDFPVHDLEIKGVKYNLYGVVNHQGSMQSGHYTSIIKIKDKWIRCDDASCYETQDAGVISSHAYILIYKVKEEIESDYYKMMNYILNNLDLKIQKESAQEQFVDYTKNIFTSCEPVMTSYGRGYVVKEIFREGVKMIQIKFRFGYGVLNQSSIKKELQHFVSFPTYKQEIMKNEKEKDIIINKSKKFQDSYALEKNTNMVNIDEKFNKKLIKEKKNEEDNCKII